MGLVVLMAGALAFGAEVHPAANVSADQVRKAETAFARSMADRDHAAFTSHLAADAVFFGGKGVQRGKAAVAAAWKPLFEKPQAAFSWAPAEVEVLDSGTLAMSSGPVSDPSGERIGTFNSIWRREKDGSWKIVFDKGCPPCDCGGSRP
jgi:ketosteroid isomerase-like protein